MNIAACICIEFSINWLCKENLPLSHRTPTSYKIQVNWWIRDVNWVNSSNFIVTTLRFSEKFGHQFSPFLYFVKCFLRVPVPLLCRSQAVSKVHKGKNGKVSMARSLSVGIYYHRMWCQLSTTCSIIYGGALWGTHSCIQPQPATDNFVRDGRSNWLVSPPTHMVSTPWAPRA